MKIEKDVNNIGWWIVTARVDGKCFVTQATDKIHALDKTFKKLEWAEIGNWNR